MKGTPGRLEQVDVLVEQKTFMSTCATDRGPEKSFANQVVKSETKTSKHLPRVREFESYLSERQARIQFLFFFFRAQ